jgi:hypothetical protein
MGLDKNLSDALGIDHTPVEVKSQNVTVYEPEPEVINTVKDQEEDYLLARRVLRNLIQKGNDAIDEISVIARQQESARGFEVVSTLIKTVGDTTKDLYQLQKMTKDLKEPTKDSDPRVKNSEAGNINVEQAVFVGSAAELLSAIKKKKEEEDQKIIEG